MRRLQLADALGQPVCKTVEAFGKLRNRSRVDPRGEIVIDAVEPHPQVLRDRIDPRDERVQHLAPILVRHRQLVEPRRQRAQAIAPLLARCGDRSDPRAEIGQGLAQLVDRAVVRAGCEIGFDAIEPRPQILGDLAKLDFPLVV